MSSLRRPIQLNEFKLAIREVTDQELLNIEKQILNSTSKLQSSNKLMENLLRDLVIKNNENHDISDVIGSSDNGGSRGSGVSNGSNGSASSANTIDRVRERLSKEFTEEGFDEFNSDFAKDFKIYNDSLNENKIVLRNQFERLELLRSELSNRGIAITGKKQPAPSASADARGYDNNNNNNKNDVLEGGKSQVASQDNDETSAKDNSIYL
ncbi:hypothetical protein PACTADRAFT_32388 [Pachysolen tannophilus NRRL Y-2460]|uniref:Uncharacterized protein n=1 Tax=Pachysolen tannophilus NRRL Y-2460 TaxID=669874 RepID=A0A1E4TYY8_PACTA|nr:hypothetical protein PACTADRAFT_32388 [Pachysolen tannophilus NRRL Y-2460]